MILLAANVSAPSQKTSQLSTLPIPRDAAATVIRQNFFGPAQLTINPRTEALADLLEGIADVTGKAGGKRREIMLALLRHGSITGAGERGTAPASTLERLVNRGIVEHVRSSTGIQE